MHYFSETEFTADELQACLADGSLVAWRVGRDGEQWYSTRPEIRGVPPDNAALVDADDEDATEIEWVTSDD